MNFLIRSALNIAGLYCFYLLNEVVWYPNFFIAVSFVVTGIYCFKKANDGTFSSESNKKKILPDKNSKKIESENAYKIIEIDEIKDAPINYLKPVAEELA